MHKHNISGIESTVSGSMYKEPGYHPGMDIYDKRDGTDTWMERYINQLNVAADTIIEIARKVA